MALHRTTILAERDLLDRLERYCRQAKTTKTSVITAALDAYLGEHASAPELPFVGIGRSAHGRLSLDGGSIVRREIGVDATPRPPRPVQSG